MSSSSCSSSIERLLPRRKNTSLRTSSTTLEKLVREENKLGSGIYEREGPGGRDGSTKRTRRLDSGRRKRDKPPPLPSSSPFYVAKLPKQRSRPKVTQHFVTKTAKRDVEDRLNTITNRIALLKIEHERIGRLTRAINEKTEEVRRRQETREKIQHQETLSSSPIRGTERQPTGVVVVGGRSSFLGATTASAATTTQLKKTHESLHVDLSTSGTTSGRDEDETTASTNDVCGRVSVQGSKDAAQAAPMASAEGEEHGNEENEHDTHVKRAVTSNDASHDEIVATTTTEFGGGAWGGGG